MSEAQEGGLPLADQVAKSIEGQEPSWKNALSRWYVDQFRERVDQPELLQLKKDVQMLGVVVALDELGAEKSRRTTRDRGVQSEEQFYAQDDAQVILDQTGGRTNPVRLAVTGLLQEIAQGNSSGREFDQKRNKRIMSLVPDSDKQGVMTQLKRNFVESDMVDQCTVGELASLYGLMLARNNLTPYSDAVRRNVHALTDIPSRGEIAKVVFKGASRANISLEIDSYRTQNALGDAKRALDFAVKKAQEK